ncbi:MAG: Hsp20/alpha crystallin family protein [Desulfocapsa sp.]|nr:Hsp20/alpha crystallin family protein [Desulfocapsa sp.]
MAKEKPKAEIVAKEKPKAEVVAKKEPEFLTPFREMESYFEELFRHPFPFFGRLPTWPRAELLDKGMISPTVDIFEEDKEVVVKAEIPGMKKSDISIDIDENSITISGEKKQEKKVEKKDYHRFECSYGSFCRSFRLPDDVNSDKAKASFKDGVLEIRMPKTGNGKNKKIDIS